MRYIFYTILSVFVMFILNSACDEIDEPYVRNGSTPIGDTLKRNILIEDFTGHKCPNCPEAAVLAKELREDHPGQVFLLTVHSGSFATPDASGAFTYDFRTAIGTELNNFFNIESFGYPNGLVSRVQNDAGKYAITPALWEDSIHSLIDDEPIAVIELTKEFNTSTRVSEINVATKFLTDSDLGYFLVVYLSEDSIIKPQKNNNSQVGTTPVITDYVHMHVLRASYNGTWGNMINTGDITSGTTFNNSFQLTLDNEWVAANCHALALLYRDDTKEVMQVQEIEVN